MTPKFPEILATFWSDISGFYPSPLDVKISSLFFEGIPKASGLDPNNCRSSYYLQGVLKKEGFSG